MDHTGEQIMQLLEQPPMHSVGGEQTADVLAFDEGCGEGCTILGSEPTKKSEAERTQSRMQFAGRRTADE